MSVEISKKDAMDRIIQWLEESNYVYNKLPDPNAELNLKFWTLPNLTNQAVFHNNMQDRFEVLTKVSFSKEAYTTLTRKKPDERIMFRRDLEYLLLSLNLEYEIIENDASIMISKFIYFDGLTKHQFFETVLTIKRAWRMIGLRNEDLFQEFKVNQQ
jgi:hypothetical protein